MQLAQGLNTMKNTYGISHWHRIAILAWFAFQLLSVKAQDVANPLAGYVIQTLDNSMQAEPIGLTASITTQNALPSLPLLSLNQMEGTVDDIALSPDLQKIASITRTPENEFTLHISNPNSRNTNNLALPTTQRPDFAHILRWSPDSLKLAIIPPTATESILVYDVLSRQLVELSVEDVALMGNWLPDSSGFFYSGASVCGDPCRASSDLYLARYENGTLQPSLLTQLDVREIGIAERLTGRLIEYVGAVYHPVTNRIYLVLREPESNLGGFSFVYSMVIGERPRREFELSAYYPASQYPTRVIRMIASTVDDKLYLLTSTQNAEVTPQSTINRLSLLSYTSQTGLVELYRYDIPVDLEADQRFNHGALSPDGRYMAISTLSFTQPEASSLVIVDVELGTVVSYLDKLLPICQPFSWSLDSSQIVYTQSDVGRCPLVNPNQPITQVIAYDIFTRQSIVLVEYPESFFFLAPGG